MLFITRLNTLARVWARAVVTACLSSKDLISRKTFNHRTILEMLSKSLKNSFMRDLKCRIESRAAATSKVEHIATIIHRCKTLITIVTTSSNLDFSASLGPPLHADILYGSSEKHIINDKESCTNNNSKECKFFEINTTIKLFLASSFKTCVFYIF